MNIEDFINEFSLPITGQTESFQLTHLKEKVLILYFYPQDDTPGCTIESNDFSDLLDEFEKENALVLGISADSISSHNHFREKFNIRHHLLSDENKVVCQQFKVLKDNGNISRSTFMISQNQHLLHQWRDITNVTKHAAEVLATLKQIQRSTLS